MVFRTVGRTSLAILAILSISPCARGFAAPAISPPALAQPGTTDPAVVADADRKAAAAYREKKFDVAVAEAERSYVAGGGANALETEAVAGLRLGNVALAWQCYRAIVTDPTAKPEVAKRADAQLKSLLAQTGELQVATTPDPAKLQIDGAFLGATPLAEPFRLFPGKHHVDATFAGGIVVSRDVEIALAKRLDLAITGPARPAPVVAVAPPPPPPVIAPPKPKWFRARLTEKKIEIDEKVNFDSQQATILPESEPVLQDVAGTLQDHPEIKHVRVEGHTDRRGSDDDNLALSKARAGAVVDYLVAHGVERARLQPEGFGATQPMNPAETPEADAQNRRVEFVMFVPEAAPAPAPAPPSDGPVMIHPQVCGPMPARRAHTVPDGVQHLTDGLAPCIVAGLAKDDFRRVAVLPFEALDEPAKEHELGRLASELLSSRLVVRPAIMQVERARLDTVISELQRTERGELQPKTAVRVGKLLGADTVIVGSLAVAGADYLVTTRAVDTETGRVVSAFDQAIDRQGMVAFSEDAVEIKTPVGAAIRSAVAPGWGQYYNGDAVRGVAYGATFVGFAGTAVASILQGNAARDDYDSGGKNQVKRRDEGNAAITRANWCLVGMGAVWAISVVDAYLTGKDARLLKPDAGEWPGATEGNEQ